MIIKITKSWIDQTKFHLQALKPFTRYMALLILLSGFQRICIAQQFDTIWISNPSAMSKVEGEACFVLVPLGKGQAYALKRKETGKVTTIEGNLTYDYLYRSLVDTPFYTKDFQQHSLSGNIRATVNSTYPIDIRFNIRKTNQPFLQNLADFNLSINPQQIVRNLQQQIISRYKNALVDSVMNALSKQLAEYKDLLQTLDSIMTKRNKMQEWVELREALFEKYPNFSINEIDSLIDGVGKSKINSLFSYDTPELGDKLMSYRKGVMEQDRILSVKDSIKTITRGIQEKQQELEQFTKGLPDVNHPLGQKDFRDLLKANNSLRDSLPKSSKFLLSLKTFSIGRSILNYSELTAKDIAITGLNVEMNPSWYGAIAVGTLNWQFRPFGARNRRLPIQYAGIFRAGWGLTEKAAIIMTYFKGARNLVYSPLSDSLPTAPPQRLEGLSAQLIYQVTPDHTLSVEFAKSSFPRFHERVPGEPKNSNWLSFQNEFKSNQAFSLVYEGQVKKTKTSITARYRQMGADFQCFTFFNVQAQRNAWQWDLNQKIGKYFFARGGMQKNQANFPGIENLKTDVVLKKVQAGFSKPKWPSIFIGYMPSSQIMLIDSMPFENNFQTLNAVATYAWRKGNAMLLSQATATRFFNNGNDTGFIYFNASDYGISQQMSIGKWQFQAGYHYIEQEKQKLQSVDGSITMSIKSGFTFSGSARMNAIQKGGNLFGYGGGMQWQMGRFGSLSLQAERSFFPNLRNGLEPFETGRLTFMKTL